MGYVAIMLGRKYGVPSVSTMRGDDVNILPSGSNQFRKRLTFVLQNSNHLTSVSEDLAHKAKRMHFTDVQVLRNGVDLSKKADLVDKKAIRVKHGIDVNKFCVLFVGAITKTKGISELLAAAKKEADTTQFVLVGRRIKIAEQINITEDVIHLGELRHSDVMDLMRSVDVLVLPSYMEGMPNVLVEAASIGLPIIATNVGGIPELINHDSGILINPGSSEELIDAIMSVRLNYMEAQARSTKAMNKVISEYDMLRNVETLKMTYEMLLSSKSGNE
jgi:teichuronic acid biosynthesis glycosyltransferase TuaC